VIPEGRHVNALRGHGAAHGRRRYRASLHSRPGASYRTFRNQGVDISGDVAVEEDRPANTGRRRELRRQLGNWRDRVVNISDRKCLADFNEITFSSIVRGTLAADSPNITPSSIPPPS
jgi:hypothetical protein